MKKSLCPCLRPPNANGFILPTMQGAAELPANSGWLRKETRAGKACCFHPASGQTQLEHPGAAEQPTLAQPASLSAQPQAPAPASAPAQPATPVAQPRGTSEELSPGWEVRTTRTGKTIYFSPSTNETQFTKPETDANGKTPEPKPLRNSHDLATFLPSFPQTRCDFGRFRTVCAEMSQQKCRTPRSRPRSWPSATACLTQTWGRRRAFLHSSALSLSLNPNRPGCRLAG